MSNKLKKYFLNWRTLVIILALAFAALFAWRLYQAIWGKEEKQRKKYHVPVLVEKARRGPIQDKRFFIGTLKASSEYKVAPKISGRLEELAVNIGHKIHKGDLLAVLEDAELIQQFNQAKAEQEVAEAELNQARTALVFAQKQFERNRELYKKDASSLSEVENSEANYARCKSQLLMADSRLVQARSKLKTAEVKLSYTMIKAQWDGPDDSVRYVAERYADQGDMLNAYDPIVSIVDINSLIAEIYAIERDYPHLHVGQKAVITTDAWPGEIFEAKIVRIAPVLKEASRKAQIELKIANRELKLRPGMFVRVEIELAAKSNALLIPLSTIIWRQKREGVFVVNDDEKGVHFVPLTIGIRSEKSAEVLKPKKLSGKIVSLGKHLLSGKTPIVIKKASPYLNIDAEEKADAGK